MTPVSISKGMDQYKPVMNAYGLFENRNRVFVLARPESNIATGEKVSDTGL